LYGRSCPCVCVHLFWNVVTFGRFGRGPRDLRWHRDLLRCSGHVPWELTGCEELNPNRSIESDASEVGYHRITLGTRKGLDWGVLERIWIQMINVLINETPIHRKHIINFKDQIYLPTPKAVFAAQTRTGSFKARAPNMLVHRCINVVSSRKPRFLY